MQIKRNKQLGLAAALLLGSTVSSAAAYDWSYVGVNYYDHFSDGLLLEGSVALNEHLVADIEVADTNITTIRAGVNYLTGLELAGELPVYLTGGYSDYDVADGFYAGVGLTYRLNRDVSGFAELVRDTSFDSFNRLQAGLRYQLNEDFSAGVQFSSNTSGVNNEFQFGVRYHF